MYKKNDMEQEIQLTIKSETIEVKPRKIRPMAWWWVYNIIPRCDKHNTWYFKLLVKIEELIRFIIRKPVVMALPTFETTDMVCLHSKEAVEGLCEEISKEIKNKAKT